MPFLNVKRRYYGDIYKMVNGEFPFLFSCTYFVIRLKP